MKKVLQSMLSRFINNFKILFIIKYLFENKSTKSNHIFLMRRGCFYKGLKNIQKRLKTVQKRNMLRKINDN